jgi:hypothetical protein
MRTRRAFHLLIFAAAVAMLVTAPSTLTAQAPAVKVGATDIGGVVTSAHGPEAGVWVIARTDDLPTRYTKIVVTDDAGRYLIPDLPADATYTVWSRGYGLVDGPQVHVTRGKLVNLRATLAPNPTAAAQYYPAEYWFSLLKIPDASDFPGTGPKGNGIGTEIKNQQMWIDQVKTDGCETCHQLGNKYTRTLPTAFGTFPNHAAVWQRRIESGQAGPLMTATGARLGPRLFENFADWTDRIAKGEIPSTQPARPAGIERNIVITEWDWSSPTTYMHDEISTDKRNPRLNAYGKIYGSSEESSDFMPVLDPIHNSTSWVKVPVLDPATPSFDFLGAEKPLMPSAFWGNQRIWSSQTIVHNPILDENGRVWMTARIRPEDDPAYCKAGSSMESAQVFPLTTSGRQSAVYDPKTNEFKLANLCFGTHHLYLTADGKDTMWYTGSRDVAAWLDTKAFLRTGDAATAQGWTPFIVDTAGTGKRTATWTEPGTPLDPAKDARIHGNFYGAGISAVDGSVWGSVVSYPGTILRVVPGSDPPHTALTEVYELPATDPRAPMHGFSPRGMDIDSHGVVWAPLASGHLASFDRRKCKGPLSGPSAVTGQQCPEGWTLYPLPGPQFKGLKESGSAEAPYFTWVDQFNTVGLGKDVPYATANLGEGAYALVNGKIITFRVPYPLGFFAKNVDGRIDDPKAGWKGRGMWTTFGSRTPFHMETGKGTKPIVLHMQIRPNPLAD